MSQIDLLQMQFQPAKLSEQYIATVCNDRETIFSDYITVSCKILICAQAETLLLCNFYRSGCYNC